MEHNSSHLLSCAFAPPMPEHDQISNVESSSNRLGGSLEEIAMRPRNLQTKRFTTIWRDRLEDCSPCLFRNPAGETRTFGNCLKDLLILECGINEEFIELFDLGSM
ncbi:hypothetical protein RHMOL_Rhmol01G0206300 [Rhododendron molle]|uniref:Uncharacterized protein n=1 Tax=Rhododendron molle TaxID=49168 RepID=A0ACC0Q398_RHOML|nr:hypothetical protein RHMOL_Rhmol01G0206300 [Rhododendron molle]